MKKVRWIMVGAFLLAFLAIAPATHAQSRDRGRESGGGGGTTITLHGSRAFRGATGSAKYKASAEEREFEVQVENVPSLAGQTLTIFVDGNPAGTLMINSFGSGSLNLNTQLGQTVPVVNPGSVVKVKTSTGKLVVSGRFPG